MAANLPSPLSQSEAEGIAANLRHACDLLQRAMLARGVDAAIAEREIAFALAHLAAEYGLDPTGER